MSNNNDVKIEKEVDQISTNNSEHEDSESNSDESKIPDNKNNERRIIKEENIAALQFGKKIKESLLY